MCYGKEIRITGKMHVFHFYPFTGNFMGLVIAKTTKYLIAQPIYD